MVNPYDKIPKSGGDLFAQTGRPKFNIAQLDIPSILQLDNIPDGLSSEKFQEKIRVLVERGPVVDDKKQLVGKIHSEIKNRFDKINIQQTVQDIIELEQDISRLNSLHSGMMIDMGIKKLKELKFQNCIPEWLKKDYSQLSNANVKIDDVKSVIKNNLTAELQKREKIKKDYHLFENALTYCQDISSSLNSTGKMPAVTAAAPVAPAPGTPVSTTFQRAKTALFPDLVKEFNKAIKSFKCEKSTSGGYIWSGEVTQSGKKYFNKYELFDTGSEVKLRKTKYEIQGGAYLYVGSYESGDTTDGQLAKVFKAGNSYVAKKPVVIAGGPAAAQKPAPQAAKPAPAPSHGVTEVGSGARYTSKKDYTNNGEVVYKVGERTSSGHYDTSSGWAYKYDENGERVYGWFNPESRVFTSEARAAASRQETEDGRLERISPKWRSALNSAKDILNEYNLYKRAYDEDNMTKIYLPREEKAFLELSWSGGGLTITKKTDDYRETVLEVTEYSLEKDKYNTPHLTKLSGGVAEDVFISYNNATKTKEVLSGELFRIKHQELENRINSTISRAAGEEQKAYYEYSAYYDAHVVSGNNLVYMQDGVLELKTENGKIVAIKRDSIDKVTQAYEYCVEAGKVTKKPYSPEKPLEKSEQQKPAVTEKAKEKAFASADTLAKECKEIMTAKEGARIMLKDGTMLEIRHKSTLGDADRNTDIILVTALTTSKTGKTQKIQYEIDPNKRENGSVFTKTYFDLDGAKETKTKKETIFYDGTDAKIE